MTLFPPLFVVVVTASDSITLRFYMQDPNERKQAEESLTPFGKSTDYIPHLRARSCFCHDVLYPAVLQLTTTAGPAICLQTILDNSNNPYAQYFASSSLLKMITEQSVRFVLFFAALASCVRSCARLPADPHAAAGMRSRWKFGIIFLDTWRGEILLVYQLRCNQYSSTSAT